MQVVTRAHELRVARSSLPAHVGLVPTMGALHAGHAALIARARKECKAVVVSIFVNPLQFGPNEDFAAYPRTAHDDRELLESLDVDLVFAPSVAEMYPQKPDVFIEPAAIAQYLEGERRPGHFRGVATVVLKLFNLVVPHRAYFGEKDAQQLAVLRRMVSDLAVPLEIVACETVREPDGLALSSRNAYLDAAQRRAAPRLFASLTAARAKLLEGERDVNVVLDAARAHLDPLREDYLAVVRPEEFHPLPIAPAGTDLLVVGAAFAGKTRLIDNVKVQTPGKAEI
jgi:pantoate--beta-alanine ligase